MLHVAAGSFGGASDDGPFLFEVERGGHFWGGGPRKCGVLRRARAGDGPGAKLLSCRRADRPEGCGWFEGLTEFLNIIRIVESDAGDVADAGYCPFLIDAVTAWQ